MSLSLILMKIRNTILMRMRTSDEVKTKTRMGITSWTRVLARAWRVETEAGRVVFGSVGVGAVSENER